ncbi:DMT family transporter [Jannaschia ovalis]|uniref:DMT family transporter n=1 Tax=Jannaschia ovalis TaxID=3038773 RepID=A0ABY8LDS3_9RHOB|nr:DMT family transporter [Jannaschia sp. GRR-S6-38]WGH79446.1 DMT family transporter [Jannaschia sp. GRR-S6-38]
MTDAGRGIALMCLTMLALAVQDGFSRHLAGEYNVWMVVMIRYWFFAALACGLAASRGRLRAAFATPRPFLQAGRGLLFTAEIVILVWAFTELGLARSHAIFALCPLITAAIAVWVLGERIGARRWLAIAAGFAGVLVILRPGAAGWDATALAPLLAAAMFGLYAVLTRLAARTDTALTSFVWTGVTGAVAMTLPGLWFWQPMAPADWGWMAGLCGVAALGQWLFIKTYEAAEAGLVQPFAYLQLVFASLIGVTVFGETLAANVVIGAGIVIAAGLFTILRARPAPGEGPLDRGAG